MKRMFILLALFTAVSFAQVNVVFRVDMGAQAFKGLFNIATDNVVVRGDFQTAAGDPNGNWQGSFFQALDPDGDTIYVCTATFPNTSVGTLIKYKFVKSVDAWEGGSDRQYTITADGTQTLPVVWFSSDSSYAQQVTNTINFTADLTAIYGNGNGFFDPNTDSIYVMGLDWDGLGTVTGGVRKMVEDPFQPKKFTTSMTVKGPKVADSTKWKFKAYPDAKFGNTGWETGGDRWFYYVADGSTVTLDPIVPRIIPNLEPLTSNVPVLFQVSMNNNPVNKYNQQPIPVNQIAFMGYKGGSAPIGGWAGSWIATDTLTGGMKVLNDAGIDGDKVAGDKVYSDTTIFWTGVQAGAVEYKYCAMYPGADTVNGGSSPLDNEGGFGENHILTLRQLPQITLYNIWGNFLTSVREIPGNGVTPAEFTLSQNYPNPFNPSTMISYSVPADGFVTLKVYNVMGEEVATLINSFKTANNYSIEWNASNLGSGIYFYTLSAGNVSLTKKMIMMK